MPLPSLWSSDNRAQAWSLQRAAGYGAALGALAAVFKSFGPLQAGGSPTASAAAHLVAALPEIVGATLGFAVLCVAASVVRNLLAERLIWPNTR